METNSFGEDLVVKARKPYKITKQREKWTEEEHNRFLEALKLYGRAWQRIEEHIGTKTAIQIRSHAQKFFTKLEKEAVATGAPLGQSHDIDIPPPRPKKKPNYPYPRKTAFCSISPTETADEKNLKETNKQEASVAAESLQQTKECSDEAHSSVVLNLFQDAPSSSSIPSMNNKGSKNQSSFREYVSPVTQPKEPPSLKKKTSLTIEVNMESTSNGMTKSNQDLGRPSLINMELSCGKGETPNAQSQSKKQSEADCEVHEAKGHTDKATVENGDSPSNASSLLNHTIPATPAFPTCSAMSYISHPFPTFPPFIPLRTAPDSYQSFLGISPAFSSQIVSTLLQNPAVHAAACMAAASLWPSEEMASDSSSMAAIAAATIAAASAWWGINGLVPFFSPAATSIPVVDTNHAPHENMEERRETYQNSSSSSSNLQETEQNFSNPKPSSDDSDPTKITKQERSSCGSNTNSSSDLETNAVLKKNGKTKDEAKQSHFQNLLPPAAAAAAAEEANHRRARSSLCFNETWKEVSQEGRLAFQALFTRDILPQSFITQLDKPQMELAKENEIKHGSSLKPRRTGFKPYKRCSAEVEVHQSSANDETNNININNNNKKIRLEGEVWS